MNRISMAVGLLVLAIWVGICAQSAQSVVHKTSTGAIVLDGKLNESVWQNGSRIPIRHDIGKQLYQGSVDNHADCSMEFSLWWDDEGLYCGTWTKDDIHNISHSDEKSTATSAWQDDGVLWWVNFDFNDVWEDASTPYFGEFGWMTYKGFVWKNGTASDLYTAYRNTDQLSVGTNEDLKGLGFEAPYWSADGVSFQCEARFLWSSFFLGSIPTPSTGKEMAFNVAISDNDGGETGAAWLAWAEGMQHTFQCWGKLVLSDQADIRPYRVLANHRQSKAPMRVYDILGRTVSRNGALHAPGVMVYTPKDNGRAIRAIRLK